MQVAEVVNVGAAAVGQGGAAVAVLWEDVSRQTWL